MWHCVDLATTDVSEESIVYNIMLKRISELGTMLAVASKLYRSSRLTSYPDG
jgi:hypothetical protein